MELVYYILFFLLWWAELTVSLAKLPSLFFAFDGFLLLQKKPKSSFRVGKTPITRFSQDAFPFIAVLLITAKYVRINFELSEKREKIN